MRHQHRGDLVDGDLVDDDVIDDENFAEENRVADADLDDDQDDYQDDYLDDDQDGDLAGEPGSALEPVRPMVVAPTTATIVGRTPAAKQAARRIPYLATAATGIGGLAALGLVEATAAAGAPSMSGTIALGTCVATGVGVAALRIRFRDRRDPDAGYTLERIPRAHRARWWGAAGLHALWIDAMALGAVEAVGPWGMALTLLGGTAALSLRWMRENRVELPTDTPLPPTPAPAPAAIEAPPAPEPVKFPTPPPPDEGDEIAELWETRVAGGDNPLVPGSTLGDDRVDLPDGYQWIVQLDPVGNITAARLSGLAEDIALRLELDTEDVNIERLQDGHARQDRALLTVITRDALADGVPYLGPDYRDGLIRLGMYADGSGSPHWTARDASGPQHGMVTGSTGSGKSVLLTCLGMAAKDSGEWNVVFTDGDEKGRSAPLLKKIAYDFGKGPEEAMAQLEALEAMFHATGDLMGDYTEDLDGKPVLMTDPDRQEEAGKLMPSRAFPGWVWIIDEFHRLVRALGRDFVERVEALARIIRKFGGAIWIGTQSATLVDWGDNEILRSLMAAGNCVIMRSKNSTEQLVVGDFGVDPTTLRKGGGYGFVADTDGRKMRFRGEYSKDMHRWIRTLRPYRPAKIPALVYAAKRPPRAADPRVGWEETQRRKAAILVAAETGGRFPWEPQPAPDEDAAGQLTPPISPMGGDGVAAPGSHAGEATGWDEATAWTAGGVGIAAPTLGPMFDDPAPAPAHPTGPVDERVVDALRFLAANTTAYAGRADQLVAAYRAGQLDEVALQFAEDIMGRLVAVQGGHRSLPPAGTAPAPTPATLTAAATPTASSAPAPTPAAAELPAMTPQAEKVLAVLLSELRPWTTAELKDKTGLLKPAVSTALGVLVARGEAWRPKGKYGTYAANPSAANRGPRP
jgi:hypothetical protein